MISSYNDSEPQPAPKNLFGIIDKRLRMQGCIDLFTGDKIGKPLVRLA